MSDWDDLKFSFARLAEDCRSDRGVAKSWRSYTQVAERVAKKPPYHIRLLIDLLEELQGDRLNPDIKILDHGCGGAMSLIFLLSQGYDGIHGVDIGGWCEAWNRLLNGHLGLRQQRFFVYDGLQLPFEDARFDFVFSNQVIEHIHDDVLDAFYSEERRVLAAGGMAYHQVPHRLSPYDSHTRTWFIHYLPRQIWLGILRRMGQDMTTPEHHLFLRWPSVHRRLARHHLGHVEDRTMERFMGNSELSDYEGPRGLRSFVMRLLNIPVLGWFGRKALVNFVMLDTVSRVSLTSATNGDQEVQTV